jgi:hypothetical protein
MAANQLDLVEKVINFELHFPSEYDFQSSVRKKEFSIAIDPALKHLLKWMLQRDPLERASMVGIYLKYIVYMHGMEACYFV